VKVGIVKKKHKPQKVENASQWHRLLPLVIIALVLAAYSNSFAGPFIFDDQSILDNSRIRTLWPPWHCMGDSARPVVRLSLAINYSISEFDVGSYHTFNVLVHLLAALTLFGIVRRTLLLDAWREKWGSSSAAIALLISLIWAVHPLQTQSVSYIIQRTESLMGLFFLGSLYFSIRSFGCSHRWWQVAAVTACALGMSTKEVMVSAPLVILLFDRSFVAMSFGQALRKRWGLYLSLAATWIVIPALWIFNLEPKPAATAGLSMELYTPWQYALTQPEVIFYYLKLCFWPHPLCLDYDWPIAPTTARTVFWLLALMLILTGTLVAILKKTPSGFLGASFFLILAPTSSIMPINVIVCEHRLYLPLAIVITLVVIAVYTRINDLRSRPTLGKLPLHYIPNSIAILIIAALAFQTLLRNEDYNNKIRMWKSVVSCRPNNTRGHNNLGNALLHNGKVKEAIQSYNKALKINPNSAEAHSNLGNALLQSGEINEAISHCRQALLISSDYAEARNNLANALLQKGQTSEAVKYLSELLQDEPQSAQAYSNIAKAYLSQGLPHQAIESCRKALQYMPTLAEAHTNLGVALCQTGLTEEALEHCQEAIRLKPSLPEAHNNLGFVFMQLGKPQEALVFFQEAIRLNPNYAEAHNNMGVAFGQQGQIADAAKHFDEALRLNPDYTEAQNNLRMAKDILNQADSGK